MIRKLQNKRIAGLLLLFICSSSHLFAQLPDLEPPVEAKEFCEDLKAGSFIKTTKTFRLKGSVRSVVETIFADSVEERNDGLPTQVPV